MSDNISQVINHFDSISLQEMDKVSLMNRTDTKYMISKESLLEVLALVKSDYCVLEIDQHRLMTYESQYYDTDEFKFYHDHHNGKVNRTKIRVRKYVETDSMFFEIKQKDGRGKTKKSRTAIEDFPTELSCDCSDFVKKKTKQDFDLSPSLKNSFNRITLVNKHDLERVTIDLNLMFESESKQESFSHLVIIEVKQDAQNRFTSITKALKNLQLRSFSMSKYCIGMISLYDHLKYNKFKSKILKINKLKT